MEDDSPSTPRASQQNPAGPEIRLSSSSSEAEGQVLEATAAPVTRGFARPGRRGASSGSRERRAGAGVTSPLLGAASNPMSPLLSPRAPGRAVSPSGSGSGRGGTSSSRGSSPSLTLSSRSQSMLRPPHPFDEPDPSISSLETSITEEGGLADPDLYARMFTTLQDKHNSELSTLQSKISSLEIELLKLRESDESKERYITWADTRAEDLGRQNEQLSKENRILNDQLKATNREVRNLETEIKRKEKEAQVFILDKAGEEPISPGTANERFKALREEIKELKEERYRQNEELEVLFEKKEKYEELQEVHSQLKVVLREKEKELEEVRATPRVEQKPLVEGALKRASTYSSMGTGMGEGAEVSSGGAGGFAEESSDPAARGVMRTQTELEDIAMLGRLIDEKDGTIERLSLRIQEKDGHIATLEGRIGEKEGETTRLKVEVRKAADRNGELVEEVRQQRERYEAGLERQRQENSSLEQRLAARETALAKETERHEAVEARFKADKQNLLARFNELEEGDKMDVMMLGGKVEEQQAEIAKLRNEKAELEAKREELVEQNRQLQKTARNVRKWQWDQPIQQTIANTQLWSEKNIMKNALESIKDRVKRIEPEQLEQAVQLVADAKQSLEALPGDVDDTRQALVQQLDDVKQVLQTRIEPLKAITQEVSQTRERLKKERDDWAKEDAEVTAVLRRIEGRGAREHRGRRKSEHYPPKSDFMKRIEKFEDEQNAHITTKRDEYSAMQVERPLGAPLTAEEDKRLHDMTREFVQRLPDNPMVAFLSGETPQARRKSQLWALTEKVKRLKIREKGRQDIHTWLPKLKPSTMEHKRKHALLVKELHTLEEQVEDLVQEINELTAPPDVEEDRGRRFSRDDAEGQTTTVPVSAHPKMAVLNPEAIRHKEEDLRRREDDLRREIRFAHARLEKLLYNRQLFEHWTENLEKRLNSEAAALVTQVLLEFELRTVLDKESKEACFCSLLECFFPRTYDFVVGGGHDGTRGHGHGPNHGHGEKKLGPVVQEELGKPKTAGLLARRSETLDVTASASESSPALKRTEPTRKWLKDQLTPTAATTGDDDDVQRSRAPESSRTARFSQDEPKSGQLPRPSTIYEGGPPTAQPFKVGKAKGRSVTFEDPDKPTDVQPGGGSIIRKDYHGHGGGHLAISPTAQFLREHTYPYFCQVMTALIWFVMLLLIQPKNMLNTLYWLLSFAVGLPFYLLQAFMLFVREEKVSSDTAAKNEKSKEAEKKLVKDQWQSPAVGVDAFAGTQYQGQPGQSGLGIMLPAERPHLSAGEPSSAAVPGSEAGPSLRGGSGRPPKMDRWRIREEFTIREQHEPESGPERPEPEDDERVQTPSPIQGEFVATTVAVSRKGKAIKKGKAAETEYVVSEEDDEEPDEPMPSPEVLPQGPRPTEGKGKETEEVALPGCGTESGPLPVPEETGQPSRGRDPEPEPSETQRSHSRGSPSPSPFARSSEEQLRWDQERMLANAEARMREEEQAKMARRRRRWWWWRVWYWVLDVLVAVREFVSSKSPASWRKAERTAGSTQGPATPPQSRTPPRHGKSPGFWDWGARKSSPPKPAPDITVTSATPIEPRVKDEHDLPEQEQKDTEAPFWTRWLASLRSFFDILIVQKIPLLTATVRSYLQSGLTSLKSFLSRLLSAPRQPISSILTNLKSFLTRLLNTTKGLFPSIAPSRASLQQVTSYPSRAIQSIRSKLPQAHIPILPSVSRLPKPNIRLPSLAKPNLKLPKFTPPRPPSPPKILGTLLSLFVIYTLLTYLAVIKERQIWTSSDATWRHAYLRDLELSRAQAVHVSPVSVSQKVASLFSGEGSSPSARARAVGGYASYEINTAYPGWSPLSADYRLVYLPLWYKVAYFPSDLYSWSIHQGKKAWESTPKTIPEVKQLALQIWDEIKGIFVKRIRITGPHGIGAAVEVPSRISQLGNFLTSTIKGFWEAVSQKGRNLRDWISDVFIDRTILVEGKGPVHVTVPSLLTTWRRSIQYTIQEKWDSLIQLASSADFRDGLMFWYTYLTFPVWWVTDRLTAPLLSTGEKTTAAWASLTEWENRMWDRIFSWAAAAAAAAKIPGIGLFGQIIVSVGFWGTWVKLRAEEVLSTTWEVVKGVLAWGLSGPMAVVSWVNDVIWKFRIFWTVVVWRYLLSWGAWVEGYWGSVRGYVFRFGEMIGLR